MPTSRSVAPVDSIRSGSRKPAPISTSSPRLTTTSRPAARAVVASTSAAAPLLTTSASSAAGQAASSAARAPAPRRERGAGGQVEFDVDVAAGCDQCLDGGRGQRGAAEVGVDDDAGCVEHRAQGCRRAGGDGGQQGRLDLAGGEVTAPRLLLGVPDEVADHRARSSAVRAARTAGSASRSSVRGIRRRGSTWSTALLFSRRARR